MIHITEDELRTEYAKLDILRDEPRTRLLTDEQFNLISYARSGDKPVMWFKIVSYWESRGWGTIKLTTLKSRYQEELHRRNITATTATMPTHT